MVAGRQRLTLPYSYNEVNVFALHFVCMLRINTALGKFSTEWKYHPLYSARNRLPYQLWHYGMAWLMDLDPTFQKLARVGCWSQWCIEEEAPFPEIDSPNYLEIPESRLILCSIYVQELTANISPLSKMAMNEMRYIKKCQRKLKTYKKLLL